MRAVRPASVALEGYGPVRAFAPRAAAPAVERRPSARPTKVLADLDAAIDACEIRDGATISFHHHLRNGDGVLASVLDVAARRGLRGIHVAATSVFGVHAPLVERIRRGTVGRLSASLVSGPVGEAVPRGALASPALLLAHGGRASALRSGQIGVDAAFVAASSADPLGNLGGRLGRAPFGAMGCQTCDVEAARRVVAVIDTLLPYPSGAIDIAQERMDHVVVPDAIGDAAGIVSGTTRPARDAASLAIAETAAAVIEASGLLGDGFSFQTGAGGISLATAAAVGRRMRERGVRGSFAAGGITGLHVDMLEEGLFRTLLDVQRFDLRAVEPCARGPRHLAMSAQMPASPSIGGAVADRLDAVVLGAAEADLEFDVDVTTKADGVVMGGSGGHADTAAGAALVTTRLSTAGSPKIVDRVLTRTTPGETMDAVATEAGVAVNPPRPDLRDRLADAGRPPRPIEALRDLARAQATRAPRPPEGRPRRGRVPVPRRRRDRPDP